MKTKIICLLLPLLLAFGIDFKEVVTVGECSDQRLSSKEATSKAILDAQRKAIEIVNGLEIKSFTNVSNYQLNIDYLNSFSRGIILEEDTLSIDRREFRKDNKGPFLDLYSVKMKYKIALNSIVRDKEFKIKSSISEKKLMSGDSARLSVQVSKDSYLYIFNISEDNKISLLYPLKEIVVQKSNKDFIFPEKLIAYCPPSKKSTLESIFILASKIKIPFVTNDISLKKSSSLLVADKKILYFTKRNYSLKEFADIILGIDSEQRVENVLFYEIFNDRY